MLIILNIRRAAFIAAMCSILCVSVARADNDGCENENNDRISPELALCSVHVYNIGEATNQSGENKQLMRDVIAMKTTVITQQMDKQYEYMEAMIRRFKTQLEKAVLTTKIQAAGATSQSGDGSSSSGGAYSGGGSSSSASGRTNRGLANAEDCMNTSTSSADAMQCLLRNITKIQSTMASGDLGTARRQLAQDIAALKSYNSKVYECPQNTDGKFSCIPEPSCAGALASDGICAKAIKNGSRRDDLTACLGQFRACIVKNNEAIQDKSNKQQQWRQY